MKQNKETVSKFCVEKGTDEERGLTKWLDHPDPNMKCINGEPEKELLQCTYDIPFITPWLKRYPHTSYSSTQYFPPFQELTYLLKTDKNGLHTSLSCHPIVQKSGIEKPWGGGERRPDLKIISQQLPPEYAQTSGSSKLKNVIIQQSCLY